MSPRLLFIAPSFQSRFPTPESRVSNTASSLPPSKQDPRKSVPSARSVFHFFKPDKSTRSLQKIINFYSKLFAQNGSHQPQPKPARLPFLRVVGVYPTIWIAKHPCPQTWNLELSGGRASSEAKRVDAKRYHHQHRPLSGKVASSHHCPLRRYVSSKQTIWVAEANLKLGMTGGVDPQSFPARILVNPPLNRCSRQPLG